MNGLKNTFEILIGTGLIVFALFMTVGLADSSGRHDTAQETEEGAAARAAPLEDRLWVIYALDPDLAAFGLEIDIRDETVVIGGTVSKVEFKNLAERIALGMDGVAQVDNLIVVARATSADAG